AYATLELRDLGFARLFSPFRLDEPERAAARAIVAAVAADLGKRSGVLVPPDGLRAVEELTDRFRGEGSRLGAALHFLRRAVEDAAQSETEPRPPLDRSAMVERFCAETGMPVFLVRDDRPLDPESVLAHFRARIIGQDEAVARMTDLIALMKAGLGDSHRPLGSFLFVGPTGVGKTEMAKALAEFLFGRRDRLVRFDMSEFNRPDSVHRFIGSAGEEG
ncbi:MAG: ATP-dependent Clp protease ATP-binding subunit, partial [Myxococcales bacterium]|nr:ATP-dependent Clp protease ATP-binding subunit [Myxococcales bacterium]